MDKKIEAKKRKKAVPTEEVKTYKVKICWFTPEFMAMALTDGNEINVKVTNGAPEDSKVVGCGYDPSKRLFFIHIEHESFDPIPSGELLPTFAPTLIDMSK